MSVNVDKQRPTGRAWPGVDESDVAAASARIARHLARTGVRSVGILPVAGGGALWPWRRNGTGADLAPLLDRLAVALAGFVGGTVGFVAAWTSWATDAPREGGPAQRIKQVRPEVVEIVPPRCSDPRAAAVALQRSLTSVAKGIPHVLVDLGGYAPSGRIPAVAGAIDVIVPAVTARVTDQFWVSQIWNKIPDDKRVGAILIG